MEGLREQAKSLFGTHQRFNTSGSSLDLIEINKYASGKTELVPITVPKENLLRRLEERPNAGEDPTSRLQLVRIAQPQYVVLEIDKQLFQDVVRLFKVEPFFLCLIGMRKGYQRSRSYLSSTGGDYVDSFFLDTTSGLVLWSYESITRTTRVILVPSHKSIVSDGVFEQFVHQLERHKKLVDTGFIIHLVASNVVWTWLDRSSANSFHRMQRIEMQTQHGIWMSKDLPSRPASLRELVETSRLIGFTITDLGNLIRHVRIMLAMLSVDSTNQASDSFSLVVKPDQSTEDEAATALRAMRIQIAMRQFDIEYLYDRAKTQSSVVSPPIHTLKAVQSPHTDLT
jgi:hypothetical protein